MKRHAKSVYTSILSLFRSLIRASFDMDDIDQILPADKEDALLVDGIEETETVMTPWAINLSTPRMCMNLHFRFLQPLIRVKSGLRKLSLRVSLKLPNREKKTPTFIERAFR